MVTVDIALTTHTATHPDLPVREALLIGSQARTLPYRCRSAGSMSLVVLPGEASMRRRLRVSDDLAETMFLLANGLAEIG